MKRNDIGRAGGISNKRRRSGVEVAAAIKLYQKLTHIHDHAPRFLCELLSTYLALQQALNIIWFPRPYRQQILPGLKSIDPQRETESESENGAENDKPALGAQPAPVMRKKECWEREEEGDEYEDCVDDAGYINSVSDILFFNIPCSLQMCDL